MAHPVNNKGSVPHIPTRSLKDIEVTGSILEYIPQEAAEHYRVAPIGIKDGVLEVGAIDPNNLEARDALNFISARIGMPYKLFLIGEHDFAVILEKYKGLSGEVTKALSELESELLTIHIEPTHENVRVRFRVDGVLNVSIVLPLKVHSAVVARIKILSNMRLDEKRKPQDGRFSATIEGRKIDFRVSTFPTYYGEKIVMRILDQSQGLRTLDDMSFSAANLKLIRRALQRPYGLVLITGPTGSGKSTTLYAMLKEVDREHRNVLSLEDPVEYSMEGVSQSQIHPEIDYTFATGLRTTLRQDPDVIMVGEIRDKETAQLAIQAALTGHLVFSTLHTNNVIGAIPRLIDMGVDPYLIAPTLALVMAQRLVRTLCPNGGKPIAVKDSIKLMIDKEFEDLPLEFKQQLTFGKEVYGIEQTPECPNGTSGRVSVIEVLEMDKDIEAVILTNPIEAELHKVARAKGMLSMKEDAILKAFQRIIPFEEINKL
ncbi:MAG: type II secretion system protein E [Parcubacteria group bacterium GW2011_GWA2_45_15]|nr:MAG: type II secretion system protein E [Parcubacteria group bacterium GW2011_GWA2_45_15]